MLRELKTAGALAVPFQHVLNVNLQGGGIWCWNKRRFVLFSAGFMNGLVGVFALSSTERSTYFYFE